MKRTLFLTSLISLLSSHASAQNAGDGFALEDNTSATSVECFETFTYANALMRAENAYVRRKYLTVIEILRPIYENIQCIDDSNTIIEIDLLLGVAYFEQQNTALAETFFMNVLRSEPDHIVGSIITIPETSARFIEKLREEHAEELDALRQVTTPTTVVESLYVQVEKEEHPYWLNFMPFGVGLFQMHHTAWGATYASLQLAGIVMSIVGGGMVEHYRGDNYQFRAADYPRAKRWQATQISGIAILGTFYLASVVHALIVHEPVTTIIHSPTQTQPDFTAAAPFLLPDGAGIAFETVF